MTKPHFLLVCFPVQGHINPSLHLAKRLIHLGADVTFATSVVALRRMTRPSSKPPPAGLSFATFSDGFDDENLKPTTDTVSCYFSELKRCGSKSLHDQIASMADAGRPVTFVIYTLLLTWAAEVAGAFDIPSALLFVQPASVLALYYYYFHGYGDSICQKLNDTSACVELPGLPLLTSRDLPSFFSSSGPHNFIIPPMREQFEFLERQARPKVLVNTFDALEREALKAIGKLDTIPVGPLIPSEKDPFDSDADTSFSGDLFQGSTENYVEWLNSKPDSSVVYVSFGTVCELSEQQEEEIAQALSESGYLVLWVVRSRENSLVEREEAEKLKNLRKGGERVLIVPWCSQLGVLTHPAVGCFMSHCGWNSTIESLASGSPVVAFPMQIDQATNAKLVEEVWKTGVRVKANGEGVVERGEIRRCLDAVMGGGGGGEEMKKKAKQWKEMAKEAVSEGGTSNSSLERFVADIQKLGGF